jgi:hypothetical protein
MPIADRNPFRVIDSAGVRRDEREGVFLPPSPRLEEFLAAAIAEGLEPAEATRLGLERFFALADVTPLGLNTGTSRRLLGEAAARARPSHPPAPREAARVRALGMRRPVPAVDASAGLKVAVPDRLLTRIGDRVPARALHASFVPEMVRWELAAALEGRTMGEWVLRTLAVAAFS